MNRNQLANSMVRPVSPNRTDQYVVHLVRKLCERAEECEWVEFKHNNSDPDEVGANISAIANSAALLGVNQGYIVWGIADTGHEILGTVFSPSSRIVGNEPIENWLVRLLFPAPAIRFYETYVDTKKVVLLEIPKSVSTPVRFRDTEYIRVGSCKRKMKDFPEQERRLWTSFAHSPFEEVVCAEHMTGDDVIQFLDYPSYFDLLAVPLPPARVGILDALSKDGLIVQSEGGFWNITNLGAILIAKKLSDFRRITRKSVRVIQYKGTDRLDTIKEQVGGKGYANGFEGLITYINGLVPSNEIMGQALRRDVPTYPEFAVRELVANALIHQDLCAGGSGPLVEIFSNRIWRLLIQVPR